MTVSPWQSATRLASICLYPVHSLSNFGNFSRVESSGRQSILQPMGSGTMKFVFEWLQALWEVFGCDHSRNMNFDVWLNLYKCNEADWVESELKAKQMRIMVHESCTLRNPFLSFQHSNLIHSMIACHGAWSGHCVITQKADDKFRVLTLLLSALNSHKLCSFLFRFSAANIGE